LANISSDASQGEDTIKNIIIFFQRIFAVYYLLLIKLRRNKTFRHLNRGGTEDFGALCFVFCSQFYLLCFFLYGLKKIIGFEMTVFYNGNSALKFIILIVAVILF